MPQLQSDRTAAQAAPARVAQPVPGVLAELDIPDQFWAYEEHAADAGATGERGVERAAVCGEGVEVGTQLAAGGHCEPGPHVAEVDQPAVRGVGCQDERPERRTHHPGAGGPTGQDRLGSRAQRCLDPRR